MFRSVFPWIAVLALSCASLPTFIPVDGVSLGADVYVQRLAPNVWRHVSFKLLPGLGPVPANGVVVATGDGALVIDTAWNSEQGAVILDWAEKEIGPVRAVIVTHAHDDRLGGLEESSQRGIPSFALAETSRLAAEAGWPPIREPIDSGYSLASFGVRGEVYFPGAGHTVDNATVWLEDQRLLVGSCLVRSANATSLGNIEQADLESWPEAIARLQERYPEVLIVVPGHGDPGGPELLSRTRELSEPGRRDEERDDP